MILSSHFSRVRVAAKEKSPPSKEQTLKVMKELGVTSQQFSPEQFRMGLGVEREHDEITHGDMMKVGHIVMDHLRENPKYYTDLKKVAARGRVSFTKGDLVEDIRHEMEEIEHRWGERFTDGGEPQVLLNTETNEVWVSAGDWHDSEVVRDIHEELGELAGVAGVDGESESYPEGYHYGQGESDWVKVYP